tara:strand:+ start:79 stop:396 length:318 start_codon:yes stop_codon:yes gene_type:complete
METPLDKALVGNQKNLPKHLRDAIEASPAKMVGVNPMTGMPQPNQITPSPINPTALGGLQNQIPGIVGQTMPGSFDKAMPENMYSNTQEAISAKTNAAMAKALNY